MAAEKSSQDIVDMLANVRTEGWDQLIDKKHMKCYTRLQNGKKLYEFMLFITLEDVNVRDFYDFSLEIKNRIDWDPFVEDVYPLSLEDSIFYWEIKYPWPLWNRDYVFQIRLYAHPDDDKEGFMAESRSCDYPFPSQPGKVRCRDLHQICLASVSENNSITVSVFFSDNPGMFIPAWVINWAARTGLAQGTENMKKAFEKFRAGRTSTPTLEKSKFTLPEVLEWKV